MQKDLKKVKASATEKIARAADRGKDVSGFFTNSGRMVKPKDSSLEESREKAGSSGKHRRRNDNE